jgi:hypothetical protein
VTKQSLFSGKACFAPLAMTPCPYATILFGSIPARLAPGSFSRREKVRMRGVKKEGFLL